MGRKPSATTMLRDRAAIRALSLLVAVFTGAEAFRVPGAVLSARMQGFLAGGRLTRPEASRTLRRAPTSSLKMQWKEEQPLPYQAQWEAFQNYNTGRWKGRCLHISPETGDYTEPYIEDCTLDVVQLEEGVQSAKQRLTLGNDTAPMITEYVLTVNDEFSCSEDGSYSLDRSFVSLPNVQGTARFAIETSLAITSTERIRCLALYDFESRLQRVLLYEEQRVSTTGAQRLIGIKMDDEPAPTNLRGPLTLLSTVGEFRGEAVGRRASRLGGGDMQFASRTSIRWDGEQLYREMQGVDERLRSERRVTESKVGSSMVQAISLDESNRLIFLPSGCWLCVPERLETTAPFDLEDSSSSADEEMGAEEAARRALEEALSPNQESRLAGMKSFVAEFGCFINDNKLVRNQRLYAGDGRLASTTTVFERRTGDISEARQSRGLYDTFDD